jgi:hypothetical protein
MIMLQNLTTNKKVSGLVLIGLAAFAYYKYSRMTADEKEQFLDTITSAGKNMLGKFMGGNKDAENANA